MHLGDIIDGNANEVKTIEDLKNVLKRLCVLSAPIYHVLGNHCLEAERSFLLDKLDLSKGTYYYRDLSPKWRLIVLDTVDVSFDRPKDDPCHQLALEYLEKHKGEPNAFRWNGGISPDQLSWLQDLLRDTTEVGKLAIVCGHLPIVGEAAIDRYTVWDSNILVNLFRTYSGAVKAYFAGHYHMGGYALNHGIHHVTFESILDSKAEVGSYGVIELHESHIIVTGHGDMSSRKLEF